MATYPSRGLQRILAGSANPELRATVRDQDGDAVNATGTITCTITRADGTVIATDRTAAATEAELTCNLTTAEGQTLDVISAVWEIDGVARTTTYHRIVGGFVFSLDELRKRPGAQTFDDAEMRVERDRVTDLFESIVGAMCPRYDLATFEGHGHRRHALWWRPVRRVRSVTIGDTIVDLTDLDVDHAAGVVRGVTFSEQCTVGYEHGSDAPDADLRDAALTAAVDRLQRTRGVLGPRVRSATNDLGITQQFGYAGDGHPTGLDEVDAVLMARALARI